MKTKIFNLFTLITLITFTSCGDKAKEAETKKAAEVAVSDSNYIVSTDKSTIEWKGFKPTGTHYGTIDIKAGKLSINNGVIEAGNFIIDMNSIVVNDIPVEEEGNAKLTNHLKSDDFFNTEAHPGAVFKITGIETTNGTTILSGNLTIKETTNNVSFPITTTYNENDKTMTLTSETFTIDRSKWNVKYGSKSFFDDLGDKFIKNDIELKIAINASIIK
ncbi:YceI family protein [Winogradskyella wichelsiae]|uniref:YceI family protein n=1 Tax=Winogradskyella wichelsiae TaxID=2697007 RepID=UPI0015CA60DF|nr:YceI family protein [Winogradskyella wichelsiae]